MVDAYQALGQQQSSAMCAGFARPHGLLCMHQLDVRSLNADSEQSWIVPCMLQQMSMGTDSKMLEVRSI